MSPREQLFFKLVAEGYYSIDEEGNIWIEKPRYPIKRFTRRIKCTEMMNGYIRVRCFYGGKCNVLLHHRIMYIHHHGDIPDGLQINHIDGDRANNRISNLEAVTPRENVLHAFNVTRTNTSYGENNRRAKLSRKEVVRICWMRWREKAKYREIAEKFGISQKHAMDICKLRTWKHLWREDGKIGEEIRYRKDRDKG